jgi:hypothetical protein
MALQLLLRGDFGMLKRILCIVLMCFMVFLLSGCDWRGTVKDGTLFVGDSEDKNQPKSTGYVFFGDKTYTFSVADYSIGGDNWMVVKAKNGQIFKTSPVNVLIIESSD